jgi:hypothetical protein
MCAFGQLDLQMPLGCLTQRTGSSPVGAGVFLARRQGVRIARLQRMNSNWGGLEHCGLLAFVSGRLKSSK